jgi:hypothetical protein
MAVGLAAVPWRGIEGVPLDHHRPGNRQERDRANTPEELGLLEARGPSSPAGGQPPLAADGE